MRNIWKEIYKYVDVIIQKYRNYCCKNHQFSFITYSTGAQTLLELTSDRAAIQDGLNKLHGVAPAGNRDIDAGFAKANEQIQKTNNNGLGAENLIIALVSGQLTPEVFQNVKVEVDKAEKMKTTVLGIAVKDYDKGQIQNIVKYRDLTYFANGVKEMVEYNTSVAKHSCYKLMNLNTQYVCVGGKI
ncbi:uncharacterized protein LOC119234856 isoform X2 [Talpa occidentalis]|nr:uncharacterized protein LOC119234856 isoform X2 [Talpa occidentalis]XP_054546621.1 uncharacterized protein LOC119234856 isoform X2 [Talpa occidentalis]XP_054546622.1 uncharacterized protein LOC119234856 isoform X2 [Talpa occidentalis]